MKKIIIPVLVLALAMFSCENNSLPVDDHNSVISLTAPDSGGIYHNGDTVPMSVWMGDEEDLHEGYLFIRTSVDTLFGFEAAVHELHTYHLDTFWVVNGVVANTNAWVTATDFNHVEGSDTAEVSITLMP